MNQANLSPNLPADAAAMRVSDRASLIGIRLINFSGSVKPFPVVEKHLCLHLNCTTKVEVDETNRRIAVLAKLNVAISRSQEQQKPSEDSQPPSTPAADADLMVELAIIYEVNSFEGLKGEDYISFANTSGVFHAWSYWREFVQNMSVRMGLPPVVLPLFRIVPVPPATLNPPKKAKAKSKKSAGPFSKAE
jgi:hypothetical protein